MKTPLVTVYVVSKHYGRYLQDAIESVLRQTFDDWELLLIDDGATDETGRVIAQYRDHPRVRAFRTEGIGLPAVANVALREANGKYLIRLDGDDIFDENALLVLCHYLERHPDVAIVFPDFYLLDEFGEVYSETRRSKLLEQNHLMDLPANGACTLMRREVLHTVGGYREDLGSQDGFDIWSKLRKMHRCANVNLPLFYYRRHRTNLTNDLPHILAARRRIKMDAIAGDKKAFEPIIAVIPCRKHFEFCADLWKEPVSGKSLLERAIEASLSSPLFNHVVVASDTIGVLETMRTYADPRLIYFPRREEDTIRSRKLVVTLEQIAAKLDPQGHGITSVVYLQAPFVTAETREEAVTTLIMNDADCSVGVEELMDRVFVRSPHGLVTINPPKHLSTEFDIVYRARIDANYAEPVGWETLSIPHMLAPLNLPMLLVHDRNDHEIPFEHALKIKQTLPHAEFMATQGLGHRRILKDRAVIDQITRFAHQGQAS